MGLGGVEGGARVRGGCGDVMISRTFIGGHLGKGARAGTFRYRPYYSSSQRLVGHHLRAASLLCCSAGRDFIVNVS